MRVVKPFLVSLGVVALMAAVSAWAWPRLPDGPIAVHIGLNGAPDGFAPKLEALTAQPLRALGLSVIFAFLGLVSPEQTGPQRSMRAYSTVWIGLVLLFAGFHGVRVARALSPDLPAVNLYGVLIGALFMLIGNYAGKMRQNYLMGVRTPWTLASEEVWDKTHRLFGPLLVLGGAGLFVGAIVLHDPAQVVTAVVSAAVVPALIVVVYSFVISRPGQPQA